MKTTAVTQRLSEHYHGTKRSIAGDGWFASVKTAEAMQRMGMNFVGVIKNSTANYPKIMHLTLILSVVMCFLYTH